MTDIMAGIRERRSIRNFEDKAVPDASLQTILDAVKWSPSWANTQCWEVIVVSDPQVKEKVQEAVPKSNPAFKSIVAAPVVLVLCAKLKAAGYYKEIVTTKFGDWFMFDLGLASQNIMLAAHALGLGTVVVGLFDQDRAKTALHVPDGFELVSLMPLGYPSKVPSPPKRKDVSEFTHQNTF